MRSSFYKNGLSSRKYQARFIDRMSQEKVVCPYCEASKKLFSPQGLMSHLRMKHKIKGAGTQLAIVEPLAEDAELDSYYRIVSKPKKKVIAPKIDEVEKFNEMLIRDKTLAARIWDHQGWSYSELLRTYLEIAHETGFKISEFDVKSSGILKRYHGLIRK